MLKFLSENRAKQPEKQRKSSMTSKIKFVKRWFSIIKLFDNIEINKILLVTINFRRKEKVLNFAEPVSSLKMR